jgi:hypothetical protein
MQVMTIEGWPDVMRTVREHAAVPDVVVVLFFLKQMVCGPNPPPTPT